MQHYSFPLTEKSKITVRSHASLRITGWDQQEAAIDAASGYSLKITRAADDIVVTLLDDCEMYVPSTGSLVIEKVGGDVHLANMAAEVVIAKVGGSIAMLRVSQVALDKVGGDCLVKGAAGLLAVRKVGGNLEGMDLTAGLSVESVGGDLRVVDVYGSVTARAGGSILLGLKECREGEINLRAGGDIRLHLPEAAGAHFNLICAAQNIQIELPQKTERIREREIFFDYGEGTAQVNLRAGGSMLITAQPPAANAVDTARFTGIEERISRRVRTRMRESSMTQDLIDRAERLAEDAIQRAQDRIEAALSRLENRAPISAPTPPTPPEPPRSPALPAMPPPPVPAGEPDFSTPQDFEPAPTAPASAPAVDVEEERLIILRMLQEKKITVDQAEQLMDALDQRQPE